MVTKCRYSKVKMTVFKVVFSLLLLQEKFQTLLYPMYYLIVQIKH